jgi:hypothetical protein
MARVLEALMRRDERFSGGVRLVEPALMREASSRGLLRIARLRGLLGPARA